MPDELASGRARYSSELTLSGWDWVGVLLLLLLFSGVEDIVEWDLGLVCAGVGWLLEVENGAGHCALRME